MTYYNNLVYNESVSNVTATNSVEVGTVRTVGDETYIYCNNIGSSTLGVGFGATVSAVTGYSVTVSSVSGVDFFVGVCKHTAIPTGSYGWLLTRGFSQVQMGADNSAAAGIPLTVGVDGTFVHKSNSTNYQSPTVGKCVIAAASGTSAHAFIRIF